MVNNGKVALENPEVRQFLEEVVGDEGMSVVVALAGRNITDEKIAEDTGLKLNVVRKILYKLYDYRLASYVRTKDKEIGWYTYTWELDLDKVFNVIALRKKRILEELSEKLEFERNHVFFNCKNDNSKISFDIASEFNFKCPKCNGDLEYIDNKPAISTLKSEINKLKKEIVNV